MKFVKNCSLRIIFRKLLQELYYLYMATGDIKREYKSYFDIYKNSGEILKKKSLSKMIILSKGHNLLLCEMFKKKNLIISKYCTAFNLFIF